MLRPSQAHELTCVKPRYVKQIQRKPVATWLIIAKGMNGYIVIIVRAKMQLLAGMVKRFNDLFTLCSD
jgi:hypothetical protein